MVWVRGFSRKGNHMGRKAFVDSNTNTETLVNEWLRRTKKKKVTYPGLRVQCRMFWLEKGIVREPDTYTRAFRRLRERNEGMFARTNDGFKVVANPKKEILKVRHDTDKRGWKYNIW